MFPKYKRVFGIFKVKDGWKDLGYIERYHKDNGNLVITGKCSFCHKRARIFKDLKDNCVYKYCPRCMETLEE